MEEKLTFESFYNKAATFYHNNKDKSLEQLKEISLNSSDSLEIAFSMALGFYKADMSNIDDKVLRGLGDKSKTIIVLSNIYFIEEHEDILYRTINSNMTSLNIAMKKYSDIIKESTEANNLYTLSLNTILIASIINNFGKNKAISYAKETKNPYFVYDENTNFIVERLLAKYKRIKNEN